MNNATKQSKNRKTNDKAQEAEGKLSPLLAALRYKEAAKLISEGDTILDIGSGSGQLKDYIPETVEYYGIDSKKQWQGNPGYLFKVKVGGPLPKEIKSKKFSVVTALAIIEHLKVPAKLFDDAGAVLKKGGKLVLTTPHPIGEKVHTFGAKTGLFSSHAHDEHEDLLDRKKLKLLAESCGFEMVHYKRFLMGMNQIAMFVKK